MGDRLQRARGAGLAGGLLAAAALLAAQVPAGPLPLAVVPTELEPLRQTAPVLPRRQPLFADLDLMRRNEFAHAGAAAVSVRVQDGRGSPVTGMVAADFKLTVNGTSRPARLRPPGPTALTEHQPIVLLVFPPNQPTVHWIGVRDALQYFGRQPEAMPWRVGIFDANGNFLPFTGERKELLRNLAVVQVAKEPLQVTGYRFLPRGESTWQQKVEAAIANMARNDGPRLIIAMNPLTESLYGLNESAVGRSDAPLTRESPRDLIAAAELVGAHIYVDNAGGPETFIPGGDAAEQASTWGSVPSASANGLRPVTAALNYFAFANSLTLLTARETMGGYANDLKDLGAQMERDLRQAYVLEFDMTAQDQDRGTPEVEVSSPLHQIRLAMLDVAPLRVTPVAPTDPAARSTAVSVLEAVRKMKTPVLSPNFRIHQRVDYFPVRGGATPVLPMTGIVEWIGAGGRPEQLAIAESVMDLDLGTPALQREIDTDWQARSVRWERDGELRPGHYAWLVAVHDADGKILSSSRETFTVAYPGGAAVAVSSLVTGTACRDAPDVSGLQHRQSAGRAQNAMVSLVVDPLALPGCRLVPAAEDRFSTVETLRVLMRLYPGKKREKLAPESWTGRFTLRGEDGGVEMSRETGFAVDAGSGLLAWVAMPLGDAAVKAGVHVVELEVRGPGIKKVLTESRQVVVR